MCTDLQSLNAQIDAVIAKLESIPVNQLSKPATDTAGKRFNQMLQLVAKALPNLAGQLPHKIATQPAIAPGPGVAFASYLDVKTYLQELKAVVDYAITS